MISVKEEDLKVIPVMYAAVNEEIKARFDQMDEDQKAISVVPDDLSKYLV